MPGAWWAGRVVTQHLDVLLGGLSGGLGVFVANAFQRGRIDDDIHAFQVGQLTQLQRGERGLQRPAPANDDDFFYTTRAQRFQSVVGDVGDGERVGIGDQDARDVQRDVAVADHHGPGARQIGEISAKLGCALYQPTKSTAATLPGRSSPGMLRGRSDCAPTA